MQTLISLVAATLITLGGAGAGTGSSSDVAADSGTSTVTPQHWLCC